MVDRDGVKGHSKDAIKLGSNEGDAGLLGGLSKQLPRHRDVPHLHMRQINQGEELNRSLWMKKKVGRREGRAWLLAGVSHGIKIATLGLLVPLKCLTGKYEGS